MQDVRLSHLLAGTQCRLFLFRPKMQATAGDSGDDLKQRGNIKKLWITLGIILHQDEALYVLV